MTGTPSPTSTHRLRRIGRTIFTLGASLLLVSLLAPAGLANHAQKSDDRATLLQGNPTAENTCATDELVIGDQEGQSTSATGISGSLDVGDVSTGFPSAYEDVEVLNVTVSDASISVRGVWVKGGSGANMYANHLTNLIAPRTHGGELAGISHWFVCYATTTLTADPAIVKTASTSTVNVGGTYSYSLTVTNNGDSGSTTGTFTVSDTVPTAAGTVTDVTANNGGDCSDTSGNNVSCDIPGLGTSDTVTITISMTAPTGNDACTTPTNTASLTGIQGDNSSTSNDSDSASVSITGCGSTIPPTPDPAVQKDGPGQPVGVGSSYQFTMTVTNEGEARSTTGVFTVTDDVPTAAGTVTDVTADNGGDCSDTSGNNVSCGIPGLGTSDSVTITVSVDAPADGQGVCGPTHTNTAELSTTGDNLLTSNDSDDADVTFAGCATEVPPAVPTVDAEKLVSLSGSDFVDADTAAAGPTFQLQNPQAEQQVYFRIIVTNTGDAGSVLELNSLTDDVTSGDADPLDLSDCVFPTDGLAAGDSVTCDVGPLTAQVGLQHTNVVTVSATDVHETVVSDSDPANYIGSQVGGEVIERPEPPPAPEPAPEPDVVAEPEPAPEVLGEELPRTGPENLWLAGLALMLLGAGLLTVARGKAMDATTCATGTWWADHTP